MSMALLAVVVILVGWAWAFLLRMEDSDPRVDLSGLWRMAHFPEGTYAPELLLNLKDGQLEWLPAHVPGAGQLDLVRMETVADPLGGRNAEALRPFEEEEWWFVREFTVPAEWKGARIELALDGIDTYGDIWLNDRRVARVDNMFIPHRIDATNDLRPGEENRIAIRILSPTRAVAGKDLGGTAVWGSVERLWARKVQASFGWDVQRRLLPAGIWRPIAVVRRGSATIRTFSVRTIEASPQAAKIGMTVRLDLPKRVPEGLMIRVSGTCGSSRFRTRIPVRAAEVDIGFDIAAPRLWWPRDLGAPDLYDVRIELLHEGEPIHVVSDRIGLRTVALRQSPLDGGGKEFTFLINGVPVFARGFNAAPLDAFPSREGSRIGPFVNLLAETGANTVRVWGGGWYPASRFYDLCDEKGILVWQDFMFASAAYPAAPEFEKVVRAEVESVVGRLARHPSIVLWCGDDGVDRTLVEGGAGQPRDPNGYRINRKVILEVLGKLDPTRPYWPSSPHSPGASRAPSSPDQGDLHLRHPRPVFPEMDAEARRARFLSEVGHIALPCLETLREAIPPEALWPPDREAWTHACGGLADRLEAIENSVAAFFGEVPPALPEFIEASQAVQAEALKRWIEETRRRKILKGQGWDASGVLVWHLLDPWPQISEAVVDVRLRRKLAYDYVARSLAPLQLAFGEIDDSGFTLYGFNDTGVRQPARYTVHALGPGGERRGESKGTAELPPDQTLRIARLAWDDLGSRIAPPILLLVHARVGTRVAVNHTIHARLPIGLADYRSLMEGAEGFAGWA